MQVLGDTGQKASGRQWTACRGLVLLQGLDVSFGAELRRGGKTRFRAAWSRCPDWQLQEQADNGGNGQEDMRDPLGKKNQNITQQARAHSAETALGRHCIEMSIQTASGTPEDLSVRHLGYLTYRFRCRSRRCDNVVELGVAGLPAQFTYGFFGACNQHGWVAGRRGVFGGDSVAGDVAGRFDDLADAEAVSVAELKIRPPWRRRSFQGFQGEQMASARSETWI